VNTAQSFARLAPDRLRTVFAGALSLLAFGGWAYSMSRSDLRAALAAQSPIWWIEQLLLLTQALVCLGVMLRWAALLRPAVWLTVVILGFGALHWVLALVQLRVSLPVTPLLNTLFLWRLIETDTSAIVAPAG
jgi:hypothetical protein